MRLPVIVTFGIALCGCHGWAGYDRATDAAGVEDSGAKDSGAKDSGAKDSGTKDLPRDGSKDSTPDGDATSVGCSPSEGRCTGPFSFKACPGRGVELDCSLGCNAQTGIAQCYQASNLGPTFPGVRALVDGDLEVGSEETARIYLDTGEVKVDSLVFRPAGLVTAVQSEVGFYHHGSGPEKVAVLVVDRLELSKGSKLETVGDLPLVIYVKNDADIAGVIDLSAWNSEAGPGGAAGGMGPCPGTVGGLQPDFYNARGGPHGCGGGSAGGGHLLPGGSGGGTTGNGCVKEGGLSQMCGAPTLEPLRGGSGGAAGRPLYHYGFSQENSLKPSMPGNGGGGGGALQISAFDDIRLRVGARLLVNGGGGGAGQSSTGAGGGSGGAILLEAPTVTIDAGALLAANGGGGAGGHDGNGPSGTSDGGENGRPSAVPAKGGGTQSTRSGVGGTGGAGSQAPGPGQSAAVAGGGGGGSAGRIVIRRRDKDPMEGTVSPPPYDTDLKTER